MAYQYQRLDFNVPSIRILTVQPGQWDSEIRCELHHVSLCNAPPYEALSYVWGDPEDPRSIRLETYPHKITRNLEAALRHLRLQDRPRTLWVDALCINQADLDERAKQVQNMNLVYCNASTVISWLGEASSDSDEGVELMRNLGRWTRENEDKLFTIAHGRLCIKGDPLGGETAPRYFERYGFPMATQNWGAFWSLMERPYWERVWIVQEIAVRGSMSRSTGVICCGFASTDRRDFDFTSAAIRAITEHDRLVDDSEEGRKDGKDEPLRTAALRGYPIGLSMWFTVSVCTKDTTPGLDELLRAAKRCRSSDPRDKIYALIGLARAEHRRFLPDYTKPLDTVLQDLVEFFVGVSGNLHIILGNRFRLNPDGPSWTPDLESRLTADSGLPLSHAAVHNAAAGRPSQVEFSKSAGTMKAKGLLLGKIDDVIGPYRYGEMTPGGWESMEAVSQLLGQRDFWVRIGDLGRSLRTESEWEAFWRTLVMDRDNSAVDEVRPAPERFGRILAMLIGRAPPPAVFLQSTNKAATRLRYCLPMWKSQASAVANRCFFTTEGRHMGIGPFCARPGDVVAILFGSPFCLILRPDEEEEGTDAYRLVGDAYLHGAMQGESVLARSDDDFEMITLK